MREALDGVNRYPDGASFALREKLVSTRLDVSEEQLVFCCGGRRAARTAREGRCSRPASEVVFAWPSFAMYPIVVKGMGATATYRCR